MTTDSKTTATPKPTPAERALAEGRTVQVLLNAVLAFRTLPTKTSR